MECLYPALRILYRQRGHDRYHRSLQIPGRRFRSAIGFGQRQSGVVVNEPLIPCATPIFSSNSSRVHQDRCAMKVCTDACILGAWFADKAPAYAQVLDIGSGTGLLMLMLAQKQKGSIRGIEIDLDAFHQLKDNIAKSPWRQSLEQPPLNNIITK